MKKNCAKFILASLLMVGALAGCDKVPENPTPDQPLTTGVSVSATKTSLNVGEVVTLTAIKTSIEGTASWHVEDNSTDVITLSSTTGDSITVTGVAAGTKRIYVSVGDYAGSVTLTVTTSGDNNGNNNNQSAEKYTVTYDANGGTGTGLVDLNEYEKGSKVTVKGNTFTAPEGKEFINWCEEADGSGSYHNANSTFKIYENVTLYAQWLDVETPPVIDDPNAEYNVKVNAPTGVTYTLSSTKAKKDDTVTLTLACGEGITLNGTPTSSQVALTKVSDTVYTFTMPANAVTITVKATIDGDVVLTGDISTKLLDDDHDGIYTAEVACDTKTTYNFTYVVKDSDGTPKRLNSMKVDETKCDAAITFLSNADNELSIAGGATYVFSYDSNKTNYNCYITRKTVDVLPMNSKTLYNLFDGRLRSQTTIHPQNLTSIHYEKKVNGNDNDLGYVTTNEVYDYKKISEKESFAVSTDNLTNNKSYVYKNIDDNNVYSIINTYTRANGKFGTITGNNESDDNVWNMDPYGEMDGKRFKPYSAKQDIVEDSKYRDTTRYEITGREAYRNVSMAAHYGAQLEAEIWNSIRGDFDGTAAINAANGEGSNISVTSTARSGGFQTIVKSQLEYNHVESGSTADVTQQYAFVYDISFMFLNNGDLYSMTYSEKYYNVNNWDFAKHEPITGANCITTNIKVENRFNENHSADRATILDTFNPADYFISSIDELSFYDSETGIAKSSTESIMNFDDSLAIYDYLGGGETTKLVDKFSFSPATALDAWQYRMVNSSDKGVAGETSWGPKTIGVGTTTVTFGNNLKNAVGATKDVTITVYAGGTFNSLFVNGLKYDYDSYNTPHADYMYGYAGKTMSFYIDSSSNTGCPVSYYMVFKDKNSKGDIVYKTSSPYMNVVNGVGTEYDAQDDRYYTKVVGNVLTLDFNTEAANALTKSVTVDIVFMSGYYKEGFGPSTLHVVVGPALSGLANNTFTATYMYDSSKNPALEGKKYEDVSIAFSSDGKGVITEILYTEEGAIKCQNVYNFTYTEKNNGSITSVVTSVVIGETGMPTSATAYTLYFERQKDGSLGVALYTEDFDIFGECDVDEEGYVSVENLTKFEIAE